MFSPKRFLPLLVFAISYLSFVATQNSTKTLTIPIAIIADLDKKAACENNTELNYSVLMKGNFTWQPPKKLLGVNWRENKTLTSAVKKRGRGMELSELILYNGKLLAVDDRTGTVFSIKNNQVRPWVTLKNEEKNKKRSFKAEWATVKDGKLYVGSHGKETVKASGKVKDRNMEWVKIVSSNGQITSVNWADNYEKLRTAANFTSPGYMSHESCVWSKVHRKWFFLPRKCSKEPYNKAVYQRSGCNLLLIASEDFSNIDIVKVGERIPERGYTSFKFLPGTNDTIIVALKSMEIGDKTATYITSFTIDGEVLLPDSKVSNEKYEGLEFVNMP